MQNTDKERLRTLSKSLFGGVSPLAFIPGSPLNLRLRREQELLMQIAIITDSETACKARDSFHSSKNVYNFDDYLFWLSELIDLLSGNTPTDKAFDRIWASIVKTYQEPYNF